MYSDNNFIDSNKTIMDALGLDTSFIPSFDLRKVFNMLKNIYAIRDLKTSYMNLLLDDSHEIAVRNFASACMNAGGVMRTHPQDFELYYLGKFNLESGEIIPDEKQYLASALDYVFTEKEGE